MSDLTMTAIATPRGRPAVAVTRDGTSDLSTVGSTFRLWQGFVDEYGLMGLHITGTFLDIGAHIGTVAVAVLLDNPKAHVIAVEPIADNAAVMRRFAEENGVADRLTVVVGGFGPGATVDVPYGYAGDESYLAVMRYIGGMSMARDTATDVAHVPTVTISDLLAQAPTPVEAAKLDCEGCEWSALADPAARRIPLIFGEWHDENLASAERRLDALLGETHVITLSEPQMFRAVRR